MYIESESQWFVFTGTFKKELLKSSELQPRTTIRLKYETRPQNKRLEYDEIRKKAAALMKPGLYTFSGENMTTEQRKLEIIQKLRKLSHC